MSVEHQTVAQPTSGIVCDCLNLENDEGIEAKLTDGSIDLATQRAEAEMGFPIGRISYGIRESAMKDKGVGREAGEERADAPIQNSERFLAGSEIREWDMATMPLYAK